MFGVWVSPGRAGAKCYNCAYSNKFGKKTLDNHAQLCYDSAVGL